MTHPPQSASATDPVASGRLIKLGFADTANAQRWLGFPELAPVDQDRLLEGLALAASPDVALQLTVRLLEGSPQLAERINAGPEASETLFRLLGASEALGEFLLRRPEHLDLLAEPAAAEPEEIPAEQFRTALLRAVGADPGARTPVAGDTGDDAYTALRVAYRRELTRIAIRDVGALYPADHMPAVGRQLADLAAAALEAALAVSRAEAARTWAPELVDRVRLAVIGMGKCGARELNYISDVDVVHVMAVDDGPEEDGPDGAEATTIATALATGTARAIMARAGEPPLWEVDANLRPEGKDGPLVRTLESHVRYYERWAESWEFQALLKARPIAGDPQLGQAYREAIEPYVWRSAAREGFVESVQAMRRRVTDNIPDAEAERQIKLGPGGLRDVEFTVQLLQLVHGRTDERVRTRATTDSLSALSEGGYIGRRDSEQFAAHYRWLRLLEHRIQLFRMRRTHLMPRAERELVTVARSLRGAADTARPSAESLLEEWRKVKRNVRGMHERIFYRPLLAALAHLPESDTSLSPESVRDRLAALGYRDPKAAVRHIEALTRGVSRRAEILRTLLPVLLSWLADGVDADAGLLGFRRLSESLGTTPWFLRLLRDSNAAAERLCQILSSSRYVADLLENSPEATAWLGQDDDLCPVPFETLWTEIRSQMARHPDSGEAMRMIRLIRRREELRVALADTSGLLDVERVAEALSDIDRACILGALHAAEREVYGRSGRVAEVLVVAMGRQGGREIGYGSDADVMYVYGPVGDADPAAAREQAETLLQRMVQLLKAPCSPPIVAERVLEIDNDLRPEGKQGPMVRSVDSYAEYYARWAQTWEFQALTRALPVAGSDDLAEAFRRVIDPRRYPAEFTEAQLLEVRRMKARVENERLPRGADPSRHVKLGRGGLSDVEWLVQTLQLQHAHRLPGLRTTSTLRALRAAEEAGLVLAEDAAALAAAWRLATAVRNGNVLRTGRRSDALPSKRADLEAVARWCGYGHGGARLLEEDYLRTTRKARAVFERIFYGH
ncbi:bifunctional [glutamine synthetase] adenylyltransferase/[glutamine synthetase]-adenylyl-L-tyrosine phosphorylase [Kocuria turfanensis]|uniref:Bifunctional glutamine synthetase adenylyltransferase/adenylyl-removing enzyme n=1 Tax=Kocuria turfanensis TaxID=388357 RepID=A0A512IE36_9MICC|nr:bifunctional [glutamine synthetase] adenylyltransferase/[glutamine synthetase]-adenylyl-L-tyrosine phosphorylase [Kocuria turfanensis]GEO95960.1 glutamate-ammonia-ligase adenylyltransferase [Kocuria turfanensis]